MAQGAKHDLLAETDLANTPAEPRAPLPHEVEAHLFVDDGLVPNNGKLPLILYRHVLAVEDVIGEPERAFEALFKSNGWRGAWVDGIYAFTTTTRPPTRCWASRKAPPRFSWVAPKVSWSSSKPARRWRWASVSA